MTSRNAPLRRALAAALLTLGLTGAAYAPETRDALDEQSRAWREATEELRLYDRLETRLILRATLHTDDYVRAQSTLLDLLQTPSPWAPAGEAAEWQVVFAAYVPPPSRADDFDVVPGATWTLQLLADGQPLTPISLESSRERSDLQILLYPQLNRWSRVYDARFARQGAPSKLTMVVSGALGQGELTWELR
ncbi:hypothetical protein L6R49_13295 [Myxococcota bacterium]|nr:hypothetical protein [Myxococcota bacterium]